MDVPQGSHGTHHAGDADTDLSFEALTFGEDSSPSPISSAGQYGSRDNLLKKDAKVNKNKNKPFKKPNSIPQAYDVEKDKSASSVYVSTRGEGERIDVQGLLKRLEQFGVVKAYYFKEKQNFGFIQFLDASVVDAVVANVNSIPFQYEDGSVVQLVAERAAGRAGAASGGGESPINNSFGASSFGTNFGIPFSPSTPSSVPPAMMGMGMMHSSSANSISGLSSLTSPNPGASITSPTPEKPDTILVLKNLPFSLKQDQLQEILMMMNTTAPQSINLHFDNMGVFRGMAFIKYRLLDDAIKVYEALNGYDVGGRKVRVEYKRKNKTTTTGQPPDVPSEWIEEEDLRKLWEQVKDFSNNPNVNEISFTPNLTSNQRKHIHTMAEKLKLTHYSNGEAEQRYICIKKPPPTTSPIMSNTSSSSSHNAPASQNGFSLAIPNANGAIDIKGRGRPRRDSDSTTSRSPNLGGGGGSNAHHNNGNGNTTPRSAFAAKQNNVASSAPADINMDWRNQNTQSNSAAASLISSSPAQSPSINGLTIAPSRQPKGPDGSKGFGDGYRSGRKNEHTVQEIQAVV